MSALKEKINALVDPNDYGKIELSLEIFHIKGHISTVKLGKMNEKEIIIKQ